MVHRAPLSLVALVASTLLLPASLALANDASVSLRGGSVQLRQEASVELVAERLIFRYRAGGPTVPDEVRTCRQADYGAGPDCPEQSWCRPDGLCWIPPHWEADLRYDLRNTSDAPITLDVGLPFWLPSDEDEHSGPSSSQEITGFSTTLDGAPVQAQRIDAEVEQELGGEIIAFNRTYVSQVTLQPGLVHSLRHRYDAFGGSGASGGNWFDYLLRTAASWNGPIGSVRIDFELPPDIGPCVHVSLPFERVGNWVRVSLTDWTPTADFAVVWAGPDLLRYGYDSVGAMCDERMADQSVDPQRLAAQIELYHGAPHASADPAVLAEGAFPLCRTVDQFEAMAWESETPPVIPYVEDPNYPYSVPEAVATCLARLRVAP